MPASHSYVCRIDDDIPAELALDRRREAEVVRTPVLGAHRPAGVGHWRRSASRVQVRIEVRIENRSIQAICGVAVALLAEGAAGTVMEGSTRHADDRSRIESPCEADARIELDRHRLDEPFIHVFKIVAVSLSDDAVALVR